MDALTAFKNDLTRYLRGRLATAGDVQVAGEYPPGLQKRPQRGCCVAVGLDGASRPGDAGGRVRLTMRFDIICPVGQQRAKFSAKQRLPLSGGRKRQSPVALRILQHIWQDV